ncbi:MAG: protein kinase domain-containing protein [Longimicrobiales bacterium]
MASFGKYQVLEFIGEGGFGRVFRGYDPVLKRDVAIKTCTLRESEMRARFAQEAEIAAGLRHPNIVTVYDFGEQDGEPYLVQEYLEGEDLDHKIKRGDVIDVATLVAWLRQVAEGLFFAHARGVVHRDVKPANVRILPDGQVRLMDFGIAKLMEAERQLTQAGFSVGTTGYLAPEQLRGEEIDHRVDIFSFGVMAYELVARRRPFEGDTITQVLYRIAHEEPPALATLSPECPPRLDALIERCLRKEREERFASFAPAIDELNGLARDLEAGARAPASAGTATAAFQSAAPPSSGAYEGGAAEEGGLYSKPEPVERPRRRVSPAAWGLIAAAVAVAVFGVLNVSQLGQSATDDAAQQSAPSDSIVAPSSDSITTASDTTSAGNAADAPRAEPTALRPADGSRGQRATDAASGGAGAIEAANRTQALDLTRVVLLVRSDVPGLFDAAEATLTRELIAAGYEVVDSESAAASGQTSAAARLGQAFGAGTVLLVDASADAQPIVAGMFSGSAAVNLRAYSTADGRLLGSERFEIGTAQTPAEPGPTQSAAAAAAVKAASYRAARFVLPLLERVRGGG